MIYIFKYLLYYSNDMKIVEENFYDETQPLTTPISKDDIKKLVFFDE